MSALGWLGRKFMGESEYSPETKEIDTTRGDEERALGLETRQGQQGLGDYYQNQLAGNGPSVAQQQLYAGRDEAVKASMAQAASGRGTNALLANRQATATAGGVTQQTARDAAMLRAGEQQAAAKQYSDLLQAQRMQDLLARGYSVDEAKAQLNYYAQLQTGKMQSASDEAARGQKAIGGAVTAIGALAASDVQAKQAIEPVGTGLPPIRTSGGMQTLQMNSPGGDYYGVGNFSPEAPTVGGVEQGASFGQRIGNALMGLGGGASGNYQPLIDAMKAQQQQRETANSNPMPQRKPDEGGLGLGLMSMGQSLSDKESKTAIRDLEIENRGLRQAVVDYSAGGFLAGGAGGAAIAPMVAHEMSRPPGQMQSGLGALESGVKRASGSAAFERLASPEKRDIATALAQVPDETTDPYRRDLRSEAARDYALRVQNFRQARLDARRDAEAAAQAAMAPGLAQRIAAEERDLGAPVRRRGEASQSNLYGDLARALRR